MSCQVLEDKDAHALVLEEEKGLSKDDLEDPLQVQREKSQSEEHAKQDQEEDLQNELEVHGKH